LTASTAPRVSSLLVPLALVVAAVACPAEAAVADEGACADTAAYPTGHFRLPDSSPGLGEQIPEPFFAFFLALTEGDSLGSWSGADIAAFAARMDRESRLPLGRLEIVERRVALPSEREERGGVCVKRIWRVVFAEPIEEPIPYSILGYHPGKFMLSRELVLSEWHLGDRELVLTVDGKQHRYRADGVTVLRVDEGHIVMDIDGWLDRLLGSVLDDAWMDGVVAARVGGRLIGIGVSVGRKGRRIFGEFDFQDDVVLDHGRPPAKAISRYSRKWVRPPAGSERRPWRGLDD